MTRYKGNFSWWYLPLGCCSVPSVSITKMQERMEGRGDPKNTSIRKYRYKLTTGSRLNVAMFSPNVGKSSIHGSYRLYMPSLCQSRYLWLNLKISPIGHNRNPAGKQKKQQPATKKQKQKHLLPSRELTYPTLGKGKSSSKLTFQGDMLVPRGVDDKPARNLTHTQPEHDDLTKFTQTPTSTNPIAPPPKVLDFPPTSGKVK